MLQFDSLIVYVLLFLTMYFEVFLLVTYFEEKDEFLDTSAPQRPDAYCPSVTIIVPAWNEGKTIVGTIESLLLLDYPKEKLSLLIIDDGSTDDTLRVMETYANHPQVRVISKENGGKYTALNLGLSQTKSDLVGCLDADSFVDSRALREIIPYFDNPEVMAVTPSVQIHEPKTIFQRMQATEYMIGEFSRTVFSRINGLYVAPGPFSIYRRSVFDRIGNFVHAYNTEDMEMAMRLQSHRMKIENAHTAFVYTVSPATPRALYKQRVRWVTGFLKNAFFNYSFMFLNRKYGNLGILVLPFAFISIFIALFFTVLYIGSLVSLGYEKYIQYSAVGYEFGFGKWEYSFDWFSLNLEFRTLVIYLLLSITLFFIFAGIRMARSTVSINMVCFILLYGFIAPFWLARSLFNLITASEARWR